MQHSNTPSSANKIFCIGSNKTGTTSLKHSFERFGYVVGKQRRAEKLSDKYYSQQKFGPIVEYCESAQVFQDVPFSYTNTFPHLDGAFPNSKFILSIRDEELWYSSLVRFHTKLFGIGGEIPSVTNLQNANYSSKGFIYGGSIEA